ncbi:MAG: Wzz/FepE/Etk N-terminal domain-containing protein [Candidatus Scalindua sp.]|nr:Wzz/FepE/Etk N-terminal domain-containing protein [Candidatus Scalindua sp.]
MENKKTQIDIQRYLQLFLRRKWFFIVPFILFTAGGVFYSSTIPDLFESKCVLIVEDSKVLTNVLSERNSKLDARQVLQAVRERIFAWESVTQVIKEAELDKELPDGDTSALEKMYREIIKDLNLRTKGSEFIELLYTGENPEENFFIVNGLVTNFMEKSLKSSRGEAEDTLDFIESDLKRLKKELNESERKFREFEDEHINDLPGADNSVLPQFYAVKNEKVEVDKQIAALEEKLKFLGESKRNETKTITGEVIEVPNPALKSLTDNVNNLEVELTLLHSKYFDEHPRIQQKQQELIHLRELLDKEAEKVIKEKKIVNNPRFETLMQKEFDLRLELKSLQARQKELDSSIVGFTPSLENIPELKQRLFDLQMSYEINKTLYEQRLIQKSKAELLKEVSLDAKSNPFKIVEFPRISYEPIKGKKKKIIFMGILLGAGLGVGLIYGLEVIDPRFRTKEDVFEYLNIPVIGMIPTIVTKKEMRQKIKNGLA